MTSLTLVKIQEEKELLMARLKELEEQEEKEKNKPKVKIVFSNLDKKSNRVQIGLSEYEDYIVDSLRYCSTRIVSPDGKTNSIHLKDIIGFGERINNREYDISYDPPEIEQEIKDIVSAPNLTIQLGPDKKKVYIYPNIFTLNFWAYGLDSFRRENVSNFYTIDSNELWRLPVILEKNYKHFTYKYTDGALELLESQLKRRELLTDLSKAEDIEIDVPLLNPEMVRGFQRVALKFAENSDYNCILALDMGLGKTLVSIAAAEKLNARTLFVVPSTLKINTYREIQKWTGKEALILNKAAPDSADVDSLLVNKRQYNIINYDVIGRVTKIDPEKKDDSDNNTIMKWVELINVSNFDLIVCDEAHYIKNMTSQRSKGTRSLRAPHKIGLTGTPIVNRPGELYPILNVVAPDKFQSENSFLSAYMTPEGKAKNVDRLHELLQDYMFRRRKEDVIKDLPPISRLDHFCELSPKAWIHYNKVLEGIYIALRNPNYKKEVNTILAQLTRLKQIVSDDKVQSTVDLALQANEDSGQKVLIFSQFVDTCAAIKNLLPDSLMITGHNSNDERYERIDKFQNDPKIRFMVLSTKAGAEGITLTAAHTVIFNDLCWTPKDHRQAEARCYGRLSDMHGAVAYYVQAERTVDEMITALLMKKLAVIEEVIDNLHTDQGDSESIVMDFLEQLRERKK